MDTQQIITADKSIPIDDHFKIIAGPGAGKTRFLVNHILNALHHSNRLGRNKKIACITYTNIGVETIVDRLDEGIEIDHSIQEIKQRIVTYVQNTSFVKQY
ncbi:UvrD-helicase domain-containing protein [Paenibacillus amylolyticus]|uniref:UvrD-helicase domain-containing protein n=1 Tax=Paenibacillus amylolyticus TaxID=1451 RepID=UPI003242A3C2